MNKVEFKKRLSDPYWDDEQNLADLVNDALCNIEDAAGAAEAGDDIAIADLDAIGFDIADKMIAILDRHWPMVDWSDEHFDHLGSFFMFVSDYCAWDTDYRLIIALMR